ncbi:hypothetical protein QTO34_016416 [Cnephaeus nilssonii]|uniref:Uncharacterized protein n=1 Tax=Cnephaeus nilssonii TaxID=3371016 RepID=A0AA40LRN3_CNENI|nr:hypothetical protein QTO34_016416 [Eptesicus nilssonii]
MARVTCPSHTGVSQSPQTRGTGLGAQMAVAAAAEGQRWPHVTQHTGLLDLLTLSCDNQHTEGFPLSSVGRESPAQCCPRSCPGKFCTGNANTKLERGNGDGLNLHSSEPPAAPGFPITSSITSFHVASFTDREESLARWKLLERMSHHLQPMMWTVQVEVVAVEDKQA